MKKVYSDCEDKALQGPQAVLLYCRAGSSRSGLFGL